MPKFSKNGGGGSFRGSRGGGGAFRGRGSWRGRGRGGFQGKGKGKDGKDGVELKTEDGTMQEDKWEDVKARDEVDEKMGFSRFSEGTARIGWLVNMHATLVKDDAWPGGRAAVDFYFIEEDGKLFKSTVAYEPYFFIACKKGTESQVEEWLAKKYEGPLLRLERVQKDDLKLPNHLLGYRRTFFQLLFRNVADLLSVRRELLPLATKNREKLDAVDAYAEVVAGEHMMDIDFDNDDDGIGGSSSRRDGKGKAADPSDLVIDIREYDVPYYLRVAIDKGIRVGLWYTVTPQADQISLKLIPERVERADPVVMAYDIETTKAPLKFPDQANDQVMMISYMIDGQGFLITNREIVSDDIDDFEYTPKPEYEGPFTVFNEPDEPATLRRFFEHIREAKPTVMATYNGDSFDFPFVCARAKAHGIDMFREIGFAIDNEEEYKSTSCIHMDCFRWVKRDSYLPQGSQGLKAVTVAKLGYDPIELDPELMTPYAVEQPQILAQYSVSDAVATYYLYMKYVHPFIFSLCNIIPLNPDEVLRKGSGTLCETLLMVQAYNGTIIMPNRHVEPHASMYEGHLLESETYVGGHVEALEAGVFRSDIACDFKLVPSAVQQLIDDLDAALKFSIVEEGKIELDQVVNYSEVKDGIKAALEELRDNPVRSDCPIIYHLDVAAMYPNIMLSNRLQPDSVVDEATCAACDYNRPGKNCDRRMTWAWRGEYFPAKLDEFKMVRNALEQEMFPPRYPGRPERRFVDLSPAEQTSLLHKRIGDYSRKVYKKTHETKVVYREAIICQRENPFYINTVRDFRDRRYVYKGEHKKWKKKLEQAQDGGSLGETVEAKKMIVLYDSLQLAHKCILNSFYGYVMRKGARWHSMEMAGITCLTGASIIQMARQLVEQIGRPLELDTDGIWCMLPGTFPDNFTFKLADGKKYGISYPCSMLNHLVHAQFTNDQYHEYDESTDRYAVRKENSIFFELDGPYRAMILPSSKEEDKLLKKRYAVFNDDGSLAELKGFEVKRRGELALVKIFQASIFEKFLLGSTLKECYAAVAAVANQWLDVLTTKAASLHDDELIDLIAENRSMSKTLAEYAGQKSTSISTAKRLAEFLGDKMVKDKGLSCRFIISAKPNGAPVTERAVPVAIFSAEPSIKRHFLRKWLKDNSLTDFELRSILDWGYYIERLGSVIQKLITIPAAMQKVANPVPRIPHPDWLARRLAAREDKFKQHKLTDMFAKQRLNQIERPPVPATDVEGLGKAGPGPATTAAEKAKTLASKPKEKEMPLPDIEKDYPAWVRAMKPTWLRRLKERQGARRSAGSEKSGGGGRIGSMLRLQTSNTWSSTAWDILQIQPTPRRPGEFRMWLVVKGMIQAVTLRIPRQFYVNLKKTEMDADFFPPECVAESTARTLPRAQPAFSLFRITVPETTFLSEEESFSNLMTSPDVDGVFEMQVPLLVRAFLRLGTSCIPSQGSQLSRGLDRGFDLDELSQAGSVLSRRRYLDGGRGLRFAFLYYTTSDTRHMLAFVSPQGRARVLVVERGRNQAVPNLEKYYAEHAAIRKEESARRAEEAKKTNSNVSAETGVFEYPASMKFEVTYHTTDDAAFKVMHRELLSLSSAKKGPTVLYLYSPRDREWLEEKMGPIPFPTIAMPAARSDHVFNTLGWQEKATKRMVQHYLRVSLWLKHRIELATRFNVPVGNIEGQDESLFVADIDFARRLAKADMLLWWSFSDRPDLGGRESDANSQLLNEAMLFPELSRPGCYTNACLEVELRDLAIDAILQSGLVYELEGADGGSLGFTEASHNLDDYSKGNAQTAVTMGDAVLPAQTFAILKSMVKAWWQECGKPDGGHYRRLLEHAWRWISSPSSKLYDPAIHRFIHGLMKKTFSQLLAEFRRLGSEIVYADFGRLWLVTGKPSASSAYAYGNYCVTAVNSRELFKFVSLSVIHFWETLLWMDAANFAGVICPDPLSEERSHAVKIEMQWNVGTHLPEAVQPYFSRAVASFILGMHESKLEAIDDRTPLRVIQNASQTVPDAGKKHFQDLARELMSGKLTRQLLRMVDDLTGKHAEAAPDEEERKAFAFPQRPGSHLSLRNPILEFIKTTCAVLALAKDFSVEAQVLKRNLLELIGVREFSKEAVFKNPCVPLLVRMVTCVDCAATRDLDLTRDPVIISETMAAGARKVVWHCPKCKHEYDRPAIESSLIDNLRRLVSAYQLQDLRCSRCKGVKVDNLRLHCDCSGEYKMASSRVDLTEHIKLVGKLAEFHRFDMLGAAVEWHAAQVV